MSHIFLLGGVSCLIISAAAYFYLFLRRDRYASPLEYARALSGSAALDRSLSGCVIRDVIWLKFYSNVLFPFLAAISLVFTVMPGAEVSTAAHSVWICATCTTISALLTLKLFSAFAFILLMLSHLALMVALFFPVPFLGAPLPAALSGICAVALVCNAIYLLRRRGLFFAAEDRSPLRRNQEMNEKTDDDEAVQLPFDPHLLAPSDRLEWMLSESNKNEWERSPKSDASSISGPPGEEKPSDESAELIT